MAATGLVFEVMDKELSAAALGSVLGLLGIAGFIAGWWRRWATVPFFALTLFVTASVIVELRDPAVSWAVWREAGLSYYAVLIGGFSLASTLPVVGIWFGLRRNERGSHG